VSTADIASQLEKIEIGGLLNISADVLGDDVTEQDTIIYLQGRKLDLTVNAFNASGALVINTFSKRTIIEVNKSCRSINTQSCEYIGGVHPAMIL